MRFRGVKASPATNAIERTEGEKAKTCVFDGAKRRRQARKSLE